MANFNDIASNQDMVNIANAIRAVTRTTGGMTIPEMPERLWNIRVVQTIVKTITTQSATTSLDLGTYDGVIKHLFIVTPLTTEDATILAKAKARLALEIVAVLNSETPLVNIILRTEKAIPQDAEIRLRIVDLLLPSDEETAGFIVNAVAGSGGAEGITITSPQGTLTTEQLATLKASTENYIEAGDIVLRYIGSKTIDNVTILQYTVPLGTQSISISVNGETGAYTTMSVPIQGDLDQYTIILNGESGTLTNEQVIAINTGNINSRIKLLSDNVALYYTYYDYDKVTHTRDYYFEGISEGIEYRIHCKIDIGGESTWTLTKKYLEIEVPLNADGTISDDSLALITKYGEHTYITISNIRYNFVKKETGKKNFIQYSNIENDLSRTIAVWTDDKTWMEQSYLLAERPDIVGSFKLYNDQWIASESPDGAFKQVVTYAHFVNNYHQYTILPLSFSLRMWAECGVGAFEETANDITFYAQTKPTDSLSFNIKHERVEYSEV